MVAFARLVEVVRGERLESLHAGVVAVADAEGGMLFARGDTHFVTFPRSSLKPFQAVGLVESGAAEALGLSEAEIALACASHHAEPFQVAMVRAWLERLGLAEEALVCGPALPFEERDKAALWRGGGGPSRVFHNCSGKHCGFLTLAKGVGAPLRGYERIEHPGQRLFLDAFSALLGQDAAALPRGVDGCGLPALALPVGDMARAAARFAAGRVAGVQRQAALARIRGALAARPDCVSGKDQATERLVRATGGRVVVKGGAEGFCLAMVPARGLGIAIKLADGASRGKMAVLVGVLAAIGEIEPDRVAGLIEAVEAPVLDSNGAVVGRLQLAL